MAKKRNLEPVEVVELFSELDNSGVLDPARARNRKKRLSFLNRAKERGDRDALRRRAAADSRALEATPIDPLSAEDPSGSKASNAITRASVLFVVVVLVLSVGMQVWYGVNRRLNTANLSETVDVASVSTALQGGLEWGNGFTQFPEDFYVERASEREGELEVSVVETDAANELELLSNSQIQAAALATNALLNNRIDTVTYNVYAYVDEDGNIQSDHLFGLLPARGERTAILTFVWTKPENGSTTTIDWELRIIGMDDRVTSRIQEQVNSVSSLIEPPGVTQNEYEDEKFERMLEKSLHGAEIFRGGAAEKSPEDLLERMETYR